MRQRDAGERERAPEPCWDDSGGDSRAPRHVRAVRYDEMDARIPEELRRQRQAEDPRCRHCAVGLCLLEERRVLQITVSELPANRCRRRLVLVSRFCCATIDANTAEGLRQSGVPQSAPAHTQVLRIRHREALAPELGWELVAKTRKSVWRSHTATLRARRRPRATPRTGCGELQERRTRDITVESAAPGRGQTWGLRTRLARA